MNLIHLVPDTVLQWIGAQSQSASAGSQAGQDFTRSTAGAMAAGGQMASQAGQAIKQKKDLGRPKTNNDGSITTGNEDNIAMHKRIKADDKGAKLPQPSSGSSPAGDEI